MKQLIVFLFFIFLYSFISGQTTFYGAGAGGQGVYSSYFGIDAGRISTGTHSTFIGHKAGWLNTLGQYSTFVGANAGANNITGDANTFIGQGAGQLNETGDRNTNLGYQTGFSNVDGEENTCLGYRAGFLSTGNSNVFLGYHAGFSEVGSNKLYIDNTSTSSPLIYGDFSTDELAFNATVRIGNVIDTSGYRLFVEEGILSEKVKVAGSSTIHWSDYVFDEDYTLNSIETVGDFIKTNKHLPNVPSASEVKKEGVDMVEMDATLLRQIEELWLHMIEMKKENDTLKQEIAKLKR